MDDDGRWARAQAVLDRRPDAGATQRQRQIRFRAWMLFVVLIVGTIVVATTILLLFRAPWTADDEHDVPQSLEILGLVLNLLGLALIGYGIFRARRAGQLGSRWRAPTAMLSREQRRQVIRQIRGKAPADREHLAIVRDAAERVAQAVWLWIVFAGLALSQFGGALTDPTRFRLVLLGVSSCCFLAAGVSLVRYRAQALRFLAANPA